VREGRRAPLLDGAVGWLECETRAEHAVGDHTLFVCEVVAAEAPDRYLINMAKKARGGRIFLDYLRNDRMATAVAPLSPRGRPGAPVSMPLTWSQVRRGLDPAKYTVHTVPTLVARLTAWEDYCDGERPLAPAIKRLGKA